MIANYDTDINFLDQIGSIRCEWVVHTGKQFRYQHVDYIWRELLRVLACGLHLILESSRSHDTRVMGMTLMGNHCLSESDYRCRTACIVHKCSPHAFQSVVRHNALHVDDITLFRGFSEQDSSKSCISPTVAGENCLNYWFHGDPSHLLSSPHM